MNPRALAASLLLLAVAACDGSSNGGGADGGLVRPEAGIGGVVDTRGGGQGPRDVGQVEALPPKPVPTIGAMVRKLIPGRARLVGTHGTACSNQPMSTERWCAFTLPGSVLGTTDLWVINMARVMAGTDVKCDNPAGADCKRIQERVWTGEPEAGPFHPTAHRFSGDTLIFHAEPTSDTEIYSGKIWAWRPGWPAKRQLTGNNAVTCSAHPRAEVAVCIENITPSNVTPLQFDLTAGKLSELPLKKVARITPTKPNTTASQYSYGYTRNGDMFLWSTGGRTMNEPETIYAVRTDDISTLGADPDNSPKRMVVTSNVSDWTLTNDGTKFLWLRNYNYNTEGNPSGTFEMADFPSGQNVVTLAPNVGWYTTLWDGTDTDKGYAFMDRFMASTASLKVIRDRAAPMNVQNILMNTAGATFSRDLRWVLYSRNFNEDDGTVDLHLTKLDMPGTSCTLTNSVRADLYGSPFLPNGNLVFWVDNVQTDIGVGEAWVANPDGCGMKSRFAMGMDFWFLSGNNAMVYTDDGDGDTVTLRYRPINNGNALGEAVKVQDGVERVYAILPNFEAALMMIDPDPRSPGADMAAGIYYHKFTFTGAGGTDGGAPAVDAGGGQ